MKILNLERINRNTHYTVFANTDDAYIFYTRQGIVYEVSHSDYSIPPSYVDWSRGRQPMTFMDHKKIEILCNVSQREMVSLCSE